VHDGIEKIGTSVYFFDGEAPTTPQVDEIFIIPFSKLEQNYICHKGKQNEFRRWVVNWVGGPPGFINFNSDTAVTSNKIAIGMTILLRGEESVLHRHKTPEIYVVLGGKASLQLEGGMHELSELDGVYVVQGDLHSVQNNGEDPLYLLWVHGKPAIPASTEYII
jgi:quercetin dioxygenase-like cupin family protein